MLIAETPEIGTFTGEEAAPLTGSASIAHDSATLRGEQAIAGRRRALRHVMLQAALVAAYRNPSLRSNAYRLRKAEKNAQGHHHLRRRKAGHHRQRAVQKPPEMDRHDGPTDTGARSVGGPRHRSE
jgi:hypothetical protein